MKLEKHNDMNDVHWLVLDSIANCESTFDISPVNRSAQGIASTSYFEEREVSNHEEAQ